MIIEFKEEPNLSEIPLLTTLEGETVIIKDYELFEGLYGEYGIINLEVETGKTTKPMTVRTANMVIIKQLHKFDNSINLEGNQLRCKITKPEGKRYVMLTAP